MKTINIIILILSMTIGIVMAQETNVPVKPDLNRTFEKNIEDYLPCPQDTDLIGYTLKSDDGKNIQVLIECRKGKMTAKWPLKSEKQLIDE